MNELLCDSDDIPLLIQRLRYNYVAMWFEATFFNGKKMRFLTEMVCPSVSLMDMQPSRMQMLEAENNINKIAVDNWPEWQKKEEK